MSDGLIPVSMKRNGKSLNACKQVGDVQHCALWRRLCEARVSYRSHPKCECYFQREADTISVSI